VDDAARRKWFTTNLEAMSELELQVSSWKELDLGRLAVDAEWLFQFGTVRGQPMLYSELRPRIIEAQAEMGKTYSAALADAKRRPSNAQAIQRLESDPSLGDSAFHQAKAKQPETTTIEELYDGALAAVGPLYALGGLVLEESEASRNGSSKRPELSWGLKKPHRIWFKVHHKYNGEVAMVTDCARISIVFDDAEQLVSAALYVLQSLPAEVGRLTGYKNRFAAPTADSYADILFTVAMAEAAGHICELQMHLRQMYTAKSGSGGHLKYKFVRKILDAEELYTDLRGKRSGPDGKPVYKEGPRNASGEPHGKGVYYYADGDKYEGEFEDGKFDGAGKYYHANGDLFVAPSRTISGTASACTTMPAAACRKRLGRRTSWRARTPSTMPRARRRWG